jgi:hypothetical protein
LQKKIRIGWAAVAGVPCREGFVEKDAAGGDGCDNLFKDRSPKVIRDHDGVELPAAEWKGRSGLEISADQLHSVTTGEIAHSREVPIDAGDAPAAFEGEAQVPSATASDIE